jgi:hypothetical protein
MNDVLSYIYTHTKRAEEIEMNSKVMWLVDEEFYIEKKKKLKKEKKRFSTGHRYFVILLGDLRI